MIPAVVSNQTNSPLKDTPNEATSKAHLIKSIPFPPSPPLPTNHPNRAIVHERQQINIRRSPWQHPNTARSDHPNIEGQTRPP